MSPETETDLRCQILDTSFLFFLLNMLNFNTFSGIVAKNMNRIDLMITNAFNFIMMYLNFFKSWYNDSDDA